MRRYILEVKVSTWTGGQSDHCALKMKEGIKRVNLGCGGTYLDGYINVDVDKRVRADLYHDINQAPLPFECDEILADNLLEHLTEPGLQNTIKSLRVGGLLHGLVPHALYRGAYADFQHQRHFGVETLRMTGELIGRARVQKVTVYYSIFGFRWAMPNWFVAAHEKMLPGIFPPIWVVFELVRI